jgi:mono/diheme cytochrome c family protein
MFLVEVRVRPPSIVPACLIALSECAPTRSVASTWPDAREAAPAAAKLYDRECASCHGTLGDGTRGVPPLVGPGALPIVRENRPALRTARDLYDYVSTTMPLPPRKIGTLSSDEYWLLVELLLRARGVDLPPSGLSVGNADTVELE